MALGAAITQYAGTLLAESPTAVPLAMLMVALVAALAICVRPAGAAALTALSLRQSLQGETP